MKVFINNRDLLVWPRAIVDRVQAEGHEPVLVDNGSTYPALLDWYRSQPCEIHLAGRNVHHHAPWVLGLVERMVAPGDPYAETDPDLDLASVPAGFLAHLLLALDRWDFANKAGLSLAVDDLPDTPIGREARSEQSHWWVHRLADGFFRADTDTTFCVYRRGKGRFDGYDAVRAPAPYTARHLPWYVDPARPPEDYAWFLAHLEPGPWKWSPAIREAAIKAGGIRA